MISDAAVAGRPASLDDAIAAAAAVLRGARRFVIGGLDADAAAIEAAIGLARRGGGAVDHLHAAAALRDLRAMRETGWIVTTPLQVRALADVVLLAGPGPEQAAPDLVRKLWLDRPPSLHPERERMLLRLLDERHAAGLSVPEALAALRARLLGRAVPAPPAIERAVAALRGARYAVLVWSAAQLGANEIELLCGLVDDLNATTRAAGLPLPPPGNAATAMQVAAWATGLPLPLGFDTAAGAARHDPWRYDAGRLIAAREVDAAVWLSTGAPGAAPWADAVPTVVLAPPGEAAGGAAAVAIGVGRPGIDHAGVLFDDEAGALVHRPARAASALPDAASVIARIAEAMRPC